MSPSPPSPAIITLSGSCTIQCPASHVFNLVLDTSTYPDWNSFVPRVDVTPPSSSSKNPNSKDNTPANPDIIIRGSRIACHVRMKPGGSLNVSNFEVTEVSEEAGGLYKVCWAQTDYPKFMLKQLRTTECRDVGREGVGGPKCEYRTEDVMGGPSAHVVKTLYGEVLQRRFEEQTEELKTYAERTWEERGEGLG